MGGKSISSGRKMCESNGENRVIIPPAKAFEIVGQASKAYIRECICRVQEQNCPPDTWEVCLLFESAAQDKLEKARPISIDAALSLLKTTIERKSIYNLFYTHNDRQVTEICSCRTCCCHPLHRIREEGNYGEQLRSGYIAVTDTKRCVACGLCEESCFFEARQLKDGTLHLIDERCFGCGKCIGSCPEEVISLELLAQRGLTCGIYFDII